MTAVLIESDQAERLSVDLAVAERQLTEAQHRASEAIRRLENFKRAMAAAEDELITLRTRDKEQAALIRRLRFILQQKLPIPPRALVGNVIGQQAIVTRVADSRHEELIGQVGTVVGIRRTGHGALGVHGIQVRFEDGHERELLPTEVEVAPWFVQAAMGEATA